MLNLLPAVRECAWLQNEGPLESGAARKRSPGGRQQSHIPRVLQAMEDFDAEVMQLCQLATRDGDSAFDAIAGGVARPILKVRWSHGSVVDGDAARSERSCPANRALMAYRMCCICAELEGNRKRYRYVCSSEYSRGGSRGPAASSRWFPRPAQASAAGKAHKKAKAPRRSQSEFICRRCAQRRRGAQCVETRVQLHFVHWPRELLHFWWYSCAPRDLFSATSVFRMAETTTPTSRIGLSSSEVAHTSNYNDFRVMQPTWQPLSQLVPVTSLPPVTS